MLGWLRLEGRKFHCLLHRMTHSICKVVLFLCFTSVLCAYHHQTWFPVKKSFLVSRTAFQTACSVINLKIYNFISTQQSHQTCMPTLPSHPRTPMQSKCKRNRQKNNVKGLVGRTLTPLMNSSEPHNNVVGWSRKRWLPSLDLRKLKLRG